MRYKILMLLMLVICTSLVYADWTPTGDINLRDYYEIKNATNVSAAKICLLGDCRTTWPSVIASGLAPKVGDGVYLFNDTTIMYFNDTKLSENLDGYANWTQANQTFVKIGNVSVYNSTYDAFAIYNYNSSDAVAAMWGAVWNSTYNATYDRALSLFDDYINRTQFADIMGEMINETQFSLVMDEYFNDSQFEGGIKDFVNSSDLNNTYFQTIWISDYVNFTWIGAMLGNYLNITQWSDNIKLYPNWTEFTSAILGNRTETELSTQANITNVLNSISGNRTDLANADVGNASQLGEDIIGNITLVNVNIKQNKTLLDLSIQQNLTTIYYNATQTQLVAGTIDAGTIDYTQHPNGNYDGITLNFTESAGSPGLDLRMNFTGIDRNFTRGVMRYKTSSLSGNYPIIQMWNYDAKEWEDYPAVAESLTYATITQPVFDSSEHLYGGVAQMRIYKASNGNTNNHYLVDWVAIAAGPGVPSGEEIDPYSVHRDGSRPLTANWDAGDYVIISKQLNTSDWTNTSDWLEEDALFITSPNLNLTYEKLGNTSIYNLTYDNGINQFQYYINETQLSDILSEFINYTVWDANIGLYINRSQFGAILGQYINESQFADNLDEYYNKTQSDLRYLQSESDSTAMGHFQYYLNMTMWADNIKNYVNWTKFSAAMLGNRTEIEESIEANKTLIDTSIQQNITAINKSGIWEDEGICYYDADEDKQHCNYTDQTGEGAGVGKEGDGDFLTNDTDTIYFNAQKLNLTINATIQQYNETGNLFTNFLKYWGNQTLPLYTAFEKYWQNESAALYDYADTEDAKQDECSEISGCVESALTEEVDPNAMAQFTYYYNESETDDLLAAQDACSEITGCVENALTVETDPNAMAQFTYYYNETETDDLLAAQDACSEITGCVEGAITSESDTAALNQFQYYENKTQLALNYNLTNDQMKNLTAADCEAGYLVIGIEANGSVKCSADSGGVDSEVDPGWDSNYTRMKIDCAAGQQVIGIHANGSFECVVDATVAGGMDYTNLALTNESETFEENLSVLGNVSIGTGPIAIDLYDDGDGGLINFTTGEGRIGNSSNPYTLNDFLIDTDTTYSDLSEFNDDIGVSSDWDAIGDVPHATPSDGDTTHLSLADEIYDWVVANFLQSEVDPGWDSNYTRMKAADCDKVVGIEANGSFKCGVDSTSEGGVTTADVGSAVLGNYTNSANADVSNRTLWQTTLQDYMNKTNDEDISGNKTFTDYNTTFEQNVTANDIHIVECIYFASGGKICSGS